MKGKDSPNTGTARLTTPSPFISNFYHFFILQIAKNEHARKSMEKSPIVRKGWLLVRQDIQTNVWSKHWFVLCGTSLSYYKDAKAEETNTLDGVIDVASAYEVSSIKAERNHGFRIKVMQPIRHINITAYPQCNFCLEFPEAL